MSNSYKITIVDNNDNNKNLTFDFPCHDDIFSILEKTNGKFDFDQSKTNAFILGLKLLGEIVIDQRKTELFKEFSGHFRNFMFKMKDSLKNKQK